MSHTVRNIGELKQAHTLSTGTIVRRSESIFIKEEQGMIKCTPYDNHFLYENPDKNRGSAYMCTCGSAAVVTGFSGYRYGGSPQGKMLGCLSHLVKLKHLDGSS